VSVKPHASPVLHAINHLLGELPAEYLTTLRAFGGLQSYPSRAKDPDPVDYSTGSVGIGATAPIWGALARRYAGKFGSDEVGTGRQYSLLGDAELDEGACWEAVLDPMVGELGEVVWVVDLNRQSLDRVVPILGATRLQGMFAAAGWQVLTVKYGHVLQELFTRPAATRCAPASTRCPTRVPAPPALHRRPAAGPPARRRLAHDDGDLRALVDGLDDATLRAAVRNLGGHDLDALGEAFRAIDDTRPTVIFAYTVKGHGLATEGTRRTTRRCSPRPSSRSSRAARHRPGRPVGAVPGRLGRGRAVREHRRPAAPRPGPAAAPPAVPADLGRTPSGTATTQAALGRALLDLTRSAPDAAARVVTLAPDVSSSTNLGGWVNKVGVWAARSASTGSPTTPRRSCTGASGPPASTSSWVSPRRTSSGCSASWVPPGAGGGSRCCRSACSTTRSSSGRWSRGRSGSTPEGQSILVGTPSGVSLAPEGGAHQSISTPSVGLEQPGCVAYEPAFAIEVEWTLLASLARLGRPDGTSAYLRLSTAARRPAPRGGAGRPGGPGAAPSAGRRRGLPAAPIRHRPRGHDRRDGRDGARGAGGRGPARGPRARRRRRLRHQPRPALRRGAGARRAGPWGGRRRGRAGSSTPRSRPAGPRRW
jgi:pyruvate dehydrogenase E1 component